MDYNTTREKLILPEYGRYVQKMIEQVKAIPDRDKRNEQIQAVVAAMEVLNPQLKDQPDALHKLWDHVHIISGFEIDVDSPYPVPQKESLTAAPEIVPIPKEPLAAAHYGRNIQNMINVISSMPEDENRDRMIKNMATYMRQQYLIWNKDNVSEETIFKDIYTLSGGKLRVPEHIHLESISEKDKFNKPGFMAQSSATLTQHHNQVRRFNNSKSSQGNKKVNRRKWKK